MHANGRNYTGEDYTALLEDSKIAKGKELYGLVKDLPLFHPDVGVDVYCIHGTDQQTPLTFKLAVLT